MCVMTLPQSTEVRFASFFFGEFNNIAVMNPPEKKLEKAPLCSPQTFPDVEYSFV